MEDDDELLQAVVNNPEHRKQLAILSDKFDKELVRTQADMGKTYLIKAATLEQAALVAKNTIIRVATERDGYKEQLETLGGIDVKWHERYMNKNSNKTRPEEKKILMKELRTTIDLSKALQLKDTTRKP